MNFWIDILQTALICFVLTDMASFIAELLFSIELKKKSLRLIQNLLGYVFSCDKCFSFWFSLILMGNLFAACLIAIAVSTLKDVMNKKNKTMI